MRTAILIRPMIEADVPRFRDCLDSVAQEKQYLAFTAAPPLEQCIEFIRTLLVKGGPSFIAVSEDEVAGWCDITPGDTILGRAPGTLGIGVLKKHRGRGLGKRLLTAALASAVERGMREVNLTVRTHNLNAIQLYQQFGFEVIQTLPAHLNVEGTAHDCLQMRLDLTNHPPFPKDVGC